MKLTANEGVLYEYYRALWVDQVNIIGMQPKSSDPPPSPLSPLSSPLSPLPSPSPPQHQIMPVLLVLYVMILQSFTVSHSARDSALSTSARLLSPPPSSLEGVEVHCRLPLAFQQQVSLAVFCQLLILSTRERHHQCHESLS